MMKLFASVSPAEWDKPESAVNASYHADIFTLMTLFSRCEEKKVHVSIWSSVFLF